MKKVVSLLWFQIDWKRSLMRLKKQEVEIIKETIANIFGEATIYLFGSRVYHNKKGGDIDLFVVAKENSFKQKIEALVKLKWALHKPIDIVLHRDFNREIEQEALRGIDLVSVLRCIRISIFTLKNSYSRLHNRSCVGMHMGICMISELFYCLYWSMRYHRGRSGNEAKCIFNDWPQI